MGLRKPALRVFSSHFVLPFSFSLLLLTACGGGGGGNGGGGPSGIGPNGGTASSSDGRASVTIPAGVLSQDTAIAVVVASNPPAGNIGTAYEFGPDGTTFNQSVTIQIAYDDASIPSGIGESDLRLGKVVNGQWHTVSGSTLDTAAGVVRGSTSSFSIYGIVAISPEPPTGVSAVSADGQVAISWSAMSDATSYNIYWDTTGNVTTSNNRISGVRSPYVHPNLSNGTTYFYIVTAVNDVGESTPSSEVSATPKAVSTIPATPQNVEAVAGDEQVTVSWNPVSGATSYNIYWNTTGNVSTSDNSRIGVQSPNVHTNLSGGTRYYYILTAVNDVGESSPSSDVSAVPRVPIVAQATKIKPSDAQQGGGGVFGSSVAIDGDYAIVGAIGDNVDPNNPLNFAGAAYIFHRDPLTNEWDNGMKIIAPDSEAGADFGQSVAINGDFALVGAYRKSGGGAAYIFRRTGPNTWGSGTRITAPDPHGATVQNPTGDGFGVWVDLSGDYAIVGAYLQYGTGNYPGAAYIFHHDPLTDTWDTGTKIVAPDAQQEDWFGLSVNIDGDYAVVGAYREDSAGTNAGAAYIFHRTGTNIWDSGVKILAPDAKAEDRFGVNVSMSGDLAIVGALHGTRITGDPFPAYVFRRTGTNIWEIDTTLINPNPEIEGRFGPSVSISGNLAIVGSVSRQPEEVHIFQRDPLSNTWGAGTAISNPDMVPQFLSGFGKSVQINGIGAIVGTNGEAYIFELVPER